MRQVRRSAFETNSSSMHSLSITTYGQLESSRLLPNENGVIYVEAGRYGWEIEIYTTQKEKLDYIVAMLYMKFCEHGKFEDSKSIQWLDEMLKVYTGFPLEIEKDYDGHVDHQSTDILDDYFSLDEAIFKSNMKDIIFDSRFAIQTDNDNY